MAYLTKRPEDEEANQQQAGGSGLLSGYGGSTYGGSTVGAFQQPQAKPYASGSSGPSATGHVNFDSIYAANEATAQREAERFNSKATTAAQGARQGLASMQTQFSSQSKAAQGVGPSAAQKSWASNAPTGVTQGKVVRGAYMTPSGQSNVLSPTGATGPQGWDKPIDIESGGALTASGATTGTKSFGEVDAENARKTVDTGGPQSGVTESGQGLDGGVLPPMRDADGKLIPGTGRDATGKPYTGNPADWIEDPAQAAKINADTEAAVRAGAAGKYTGPNALSDMTGYKSVLADYGKAGDALDALRDDDHLQAAYDKEVVGPYIEGGSRLDAALAGRAGRPQFAQTREAHKGIGGELGAAQKASWTDARAAKAIAEANANAYKGLLGEYTGRVGSEQEAEDKRQKDSDDAVTDAALHAGNIAKYDEYRHGGTLMDKLRNTLHGAQAMSPIDAGLTAAGKQSFADAATNKLSPQSSTNKGNVSPAWGDDDADVYASMSDADWAEFNTFSVGEQRTWIANRKKQIRGGG